MFKIHNEIFSLTISDLGAELEELCINGINILWKRNDLWDSQSPILFPIVGNLKDGYYTYDEKKYEMKSHGFLKNMIFEPVKIESSLITLKSSYTEETLTQYPFRFEFYVTYALILNKLKIKFEIKNLDDQEMVFSCGFHPGFDLAQMENVLGKNLFFQFSPLQVQRIQFNPHFVKQIEPVELSLKTTLTDFSKDLNLYKTVCYQGVNQIHLYGENNGLCFNHNLPFTAFWQRNPECPQFICVEPWGGLPDEESTDHKLIHKKHIQRLDAKQSKEYEIEIHFIKGVE